MTENPPAGTPRQAELPQMVARGDSEIFFDALALADLPDLYPGRGVELLGRLLKALAGASAPAATNSPPRDACCRAPGSPFGRNAGSQDENAHCLIQPKGLRPASCLIPGLSQGAVNPADEFLHLRQH